MHSVTGCQKASNTAIMHIATLVLVLSLRAGILSYYRHHPRADDPYALLELVWYIPIKEIVEDG
jgi:hypothetical protein